MAENLRKDIDFHGIFRKLGHSLEEIRVRALENIQSKLEHQLICDADIIHEKHLYIRLLEWFNIPECSHKGEVLSLLNRLAQHSAGAQLLQDVGGIEFLSQLRSDIEPCHRPVIDQILENVMRLPDPGMEGHAPECIYHKPTDSAVWGVSMSSAGDGSRAHVSHTSETPGSRVSASMDRLSQHVHQSPGYFATSVEGQGAGSSQNDAKVYSGPTSDFIVDPVAAENTRGFFRLSTFPWLPLTHTDQQVIASTNSSLQTKDPGMLIGACEFLADVVFQDFPAELFLQRPEILKSLLSLVSLPNPADHPVVIQTCRTLTCFIRCLQVRIRYFQDPVLYTSKQDFNSSTPSITTSTTTSSSSHLNLPSTQHRNSNGWGDRRHRGDGQDGDSSTSASRESSVGLEPDSNNPDDDLDYDDGPQLQHQQLTLPQLCVAVLQRSLPRLQTAHEALGVGVLELVQEVVTVLVSVLDASLWTDGRDAARDMVDRLTDCLDSVSELLDFHHYSHHSVTPIDTELGDLSTHRILYMGLAAALTRFLLLVPLDRMNSVLPERVKASLHYLVYDEPLALTYPRCRVICLAVTQSLGLSVPVDFQHTLDICRSLTKTCAFCLQCEGGTLKRAELALLAEEALPSLIYHLHLPFVSKFVQFISTICSEKKTEKSVVTQCTEVLLKLMSFQIDSVRQVCYTAIVDIVKKTLQVLHGIAPKSKESLKCKFVTHPDVLYEMVCFGLADQNAKIRTCSTECLHHLLQSQLLMSNGMWQDFILALTKSLPVLQSYTDQSTALGRRLWSMLDPTTTTHNLALLDKLRGCLRLMYLSDKKMRTDAAKHLKWFLSNEQNSESKLPIASELDPINMSCCLVLTSTQLIEEDNSRSFFTESSMKQVYDIFTSDPVDPGVKKSAGDQLAIMMKDPHLHGFFKIRGGVEVACSTIQNSVKQGNEGETKEDVEPYLPACLSMLRSLTHHDYTLRHTLARDNDLYYCLIRVALLHQADEEIKSDVSHLLTLLIFDEVAKFDIGSGQAESPGTKFSLPAQVIQRYRLPFKPSCHHVSSPSTMALPDDNNDIMTTSGPREMMKVAWNVAWQGGLEQLLDSFRTRLFSETNNEFNSVLALTPVERTVLEVSNLLWRLSRNMQAVRDASSHAGVVSALDSMLSITRALKFPTVVEFFSKNDWYTALEKFLMVTPTSSSDQSLLLQVLHFISSALHCLKCLPLSPGATPNPALTWLIDKLYRPDGPLVSLMNKPVGGAGEGAESGGSLASIKRSLDKELLHYVMTINSYLPYQLCKRPRPGQMRGDFVRRLQHRLNITDAPHFYNLASLEGTLACLMHVTARPGWSEECSELDATALCNQLLNTLLEVVWSFHIGRGGTSRSFMGKGVTKSTTLCLRHLAYEMISNSEDQNWVKNWLYTRQDHNPNTDQGLNWLLTLWAYRDPEVRTAGLGIAVALTSTEAGRLLVTSNCKHIPGGVWGAAFSILLDSVECSMVCQQAALLLVNLTSQPMLSGEVETTAGTWQGPIVTDSDYQVMLVGVNALVALLDHTNFYTSVVDLLASLYTSSLIQPVLVTTEIPLQLDSDNSSLSLTDASSLENTGRTQFTVVSSLSANPTPNLTARSKTLSTDRSKTSANNSQENTQSTSSNTEVPADSQGIRREKSGQPASDPGVMSESENVATPGLITAIIKLLTNVVNLTPQTCLNNMRSHSIISSLLSLVNPATVQSLCQEMTSGQAGSASALALHDLLLMYGSIADLLIACLTLDTNTRAELLKNRAGLKSLASLLLLQWQEKDDVGNACAYASVSVLNFLSSLLQTQGLTALNTLTAVLGPMWSPLAESMCTMLDDRSSDRVNLYLACLDFLSLLCCEESRSVVKNPDRVVEVATVSELMDATLISSNVQENDKDDGSTGRQLCKVLVGVFETVVLCGGNDKAAALRDVNGRLKVISGLKSLLAVSQSAKKFALEAGLVESTIEHLKQTHAQLNLETLGIVKAGGKKEEPLLQELVMIFDFLRNFMCNNPDVKVACHHSGLTTVVQRLWAWCQQEPSLLTSVLSLLTSYTAHCNSAAGSLTTTMTYQTTGKAGGQGSLLHYLIKLTQKELDRDECSPTLRLAFSLLTNLVMNSECRNMLWKSPFLLQFSKLNPRKQRRKVRVAVETLWCELLLALSFSVDGQQIILKIQDVLTVLMDMIEAGSSRCQVCSTLIIRNLCCHAPNKPKLLAADNLISVLMQQIESSEDEQVQLIATSALSALVYNNHKAKVHVKSANVAPRLVDALHDLQTSGSMTQTSRKRCENLKAIIAAVRD